MVRPSRSSSARSRFSSARRKRSAGSRAPTRAGREAEARALLAQLEAARRGESFNVTHTARVYAALGDNARALALLEQGVSERQRDVVDAQQDPYFASLRTEPKFAQLFERMGLGAAR
jgi:hypothetical protein